MEILYENYDDNVFMMNSMDHMNHFLLGLMKKVTQ